MVARLNIGRKVGAIDMPFDQSSFRSLQFRWLHFVLVIIELENSMAQELVDPGRAAEGVVLGSRWILILNES